MREPISKFRDFLGPYEYKPSIIYFSVLALNFSNLRSYTFEYQFGSERVKFFLVGAITYAIMGIPLYLAFKFSQLVSRARTKKFSIYLLELLIGCFISLITQFGFQKYIIPKLDTINFIQNGRFLGELVIRFAFAIFFVAVTHNRLRILSVNLKQTHSLNSELNARYAKLIDSDEKIRSQAAQLLHDRIQGKLMLAGAKLTRLSNVLSDEGKMGMLPIIKELEQIRSIDVREVAELLSPNLAGDGLAGSCENLYREFEGNIDFITEIDSIVEEFADEVKLGIYRIIEQGVINAIKHGPATKVAVRVQHDSNRFVIVEVSDNGPAKESAGSGKGSVIIDAWLSILGGKKEIDSIAGTGYTLRVFLPKRLRD